MLKNFIIHWSVPHVTTDEGNPLWSFLISVFKKKFYWPTYLLWMIYTRLSLLIILIFLDWSNAQRHSGSLPLSTAIVDINIICSTNRSLRHLYPKNDISNYYYVISVTGAAIDATARAENDIYYYFVNVPYSCRLQVY